MAEQKQVEGPIWLMHIVFQSLICIIEDRILGYQVSDSVFK